MKLVLAERRDGSVRDGSTAQWHDNTETDKGTSWIQAITKALYHRGIAKVNISHNGLVEKSHFRQYPDHNKQMLNVRVTDALITLISSLHIENKYCNTSLYPANMHNYGIICKNLKKNSN